MDEQHPNLDLEVDPKLSYALRNPGKFPVDINRDDYEMILRVPGIGVKSAQKIVSSRQHQRLRLDHLQAMGVVVKRARHFIRCQGSQIAPGERPMADLRKMLLAEEQNRQSAQLSLFG